MSLFKTSQGYVSHADAVPEVKHVPSRRQAETAFCEIVTRLDSKEVDLIGDEISALRDFIWSR